MSNEQRLIIYGVPFSQPVRAVLWLLIHKRRVFELEPINPGSKGERGSRNPTFLAMNPAGTIPTLREPDSGFVLAEAHAILAYLASSHGWTDMYPEDPRSKAAVDWYLHFHHRAIRSASLLVAPKVRKDIVLSPERTEEAHRTLTAGLRALNDGWLAESPFLAGDHATIADLSAYTEIGQLQPQFTNLMAFDAYPNIERWLKAMKQVDGHDDAHVVLSELGDISQEAPPMEVLKGANKASLRAIASTVASF